MNISTITGNKIIKGTFILTLSSFISRIIGFLFRIFLTGKIGAEALGIIQLIFPIQIICCSICGFGFENAISKLTAESKIYKDNSKNTYFINGVFISFLISIIVMFFTFSFSKIISNRYILEPRCNVLLKIMSISIPISSIHYCIYGYYLGHRNTKIPAISQIVEQIVRVLSICIFIFIADMYNYRITPSYVITGTVIGETSATIYCLLMLRKSKVSLNPEDINKSNIKKILSLSTPLSLNRLLSSILQSFQNILIPNMLIIYGLTNSESLGVYGIVTGIVIPLVFFPSAIIHSFCLMILPTISEANSRKNNSKINFATNKSIELCIIFGVFCSTIFYNYGNVIGELLLNSNDVGKYVSLLGLICPFIYISAILTSIINGLGHTGITFLINIITSVIQIFLIVTVIPKYGVLGFIYAFIIGNFINSSILFVYTKTKIKISASIIYTLILSVVTTLFISNFANLVLSCVGNKIIKIGCHFCIYTIWYCVIFRKKIFQLG
ncbi:MAG: oligosaccharide flippase family protein [Lachnospiraceae bacterium]|nr:oligosaccharide flippase family protein [Lachnospiraceae bacterium]